jgi:transcriptional regulator with XRE-family HTH domain
MISIPTKIKIELLKKGVTGAEIARKLGVHRCAIYLVISGRAKSRRIRKAICEATGLPWSIWDELDKEVKEKKEAA